MYLMFLFRQITDKYKKEAYYDFEEIPDGIKAKLKDIITKTVVNITLDTNWHQQSVSYTRFLSSEVSGFISLLDRTC